MSTTALDAATLALRTLMLTGMGAGLVALADPKTFLKYFYFGYELEAKPHSLTDDFLLHMVTAHGLQLLATTGLLCCVVHSTTKLSLLMLAGGFTIFAASIFVCFLGPNSDILELGREPEIVERQRQIWVLIHVLIAVVMYFASQVAPSSKSLHAKNFAPAIFGLDTIGLALTGMVMLWKPHYFILVMTKSTSTPVLRVLTQVSGLFNIQQALLIFANMKRTTANFTLAVAVRHFMSFALYASLFFFAGDAASGFLPQGFVTLGMIYHGLFGLVSYLCHQHY